MCDDVWVVGWAARELVPHMWLRPAVLSTLPSRVAVLKGLLGVEKLGLHLDLSRVAFIKINGAVNALREVRRITGASIINVC